MLKTFESRQTNQNFESGYFFFYQALIQTLIFQLINQPTMIINDFVDVLLGE